MKLTEKIESYLNESEYDNFMDELRTAFNKTNKDKTFVKAT